MRREQHPAITQIVRFGLPLVVAVFYATAARGFAYTADAGYSAAEWAQHLLGPIATPPAITLFSPLWTLLTALGGLMGLDVLLVAKVLSLVFGCFALLALYLLSVELLDDRILAFCVSLIVALDPWLLQAGPSGTAATALAALSIAALFFMRREDFALASLLVGFCTLIALPAAALFVSLLLEISAARRERGSIKVMAASGLVYLAVLLPWFMFALLKGLPFLPSVQVPGDSIAISWFGVLTIVMSASLAIAGLITVRRSPLVRLLAGDQVTGLWIWVVWIACAGLVFDRDVWLAGLPVLALLALHGLRAIVPALRDDAPNYSFAFLFVGIMLVLNQSTYFLLTKGAMARAMEDQQAVAVIAQWIKSNIPDVTTVESEEPGTLEYFLRTGTRVVPLEKAPRSQLILTARTEVPGYEEVYRPAPVIDDSSRHEHGRVALFRRHLQESQP
jgi:hypothetical protein